MKNLWLFLTSVKYFDAPRNNADFKGEVEKNSQEILEKNKEKTEHIKAQQELEVKGSFERGKVNQKQKEIQTVGKKIDGLSHNIANITEKIGEKMKWISQKWKEISKKRGEIAKSQKMIGQFESVLGDIGKNLSKIQSRMTVLKNNMKTARESIQLLKGNTDVESKARIQSAENFIKKLEQAQREAEVDRNRYSRLKTENEWLLKTEQAKKAGLEWEEKKLQWEKVWLEKEKKSLEWNKNTLNAEKKNAMQVQKNLISEHKILQNKVATLQNLAMVEHGLVEKYNQEIEGLKTGQKTAVENAKVQNAENIQAAENAVDTAEKVKNIAQNVENGDKTEGVAQMERAKTILEKGGMKAKKRFVEIFKRIIGKHKWDKRSAFLEASNILAEEKKQELAGLRVESEKIQSVEWKMQGNDQELPAKPQIEVPMNVVEKWADVSAEAGGDRKKQPEKEQDVQVVVEQNVEVKKLEENFQDVKIEANWAEDNVSGEVVSEKQTENFENTSVFEGERSEVQTEKVQSESLKNFQENNSDQLSKQDWVVESTQNTENSQEKNTAENAVKMPENVEAKVNSSQNVKEKNPEKLVGTTDTTNVDLDEALGKNPPENKEKSSMRYTDAKDIQSVLNILERENVKADEVEYIEYDAQEVLQVQSDFGEASQIFVKLKLKWESTPVYINVSRQKFIENIQKWKGWVNWEVLDKMTKTAAVLEKVDKNARENLQNLQSHFKKNGLTPKELEKNLPFLRWTAEEKKILLERFQSIFEQWEKSGLSQDMTAELLDGLNNISPKAIYESLSAEKKQAFDQALKEDLFGNKRTEAEIQELQNKIKNNDHITDGAVLKLLKKNMPWAWFSEVAALADDIADESIINSVDADNALQKINNGETDFDEYYQDIIDDFYEVYNIERFEFSQQTLKESAQLVELVQAVPYVSDILSEPPKNAREAQQALREGKKIPISIDNEEIAKQTQMLMYLRPGTTNLVANIHGNEFDVPANLKTPTEIFSYINLMKDLTSDPIFTRFLKAEQKASMKFLQEEFVKKYPNEKIGANKNHFYEIIFSVIGRATGKKELENMNSEAVQKEVKKWADPVNSNNLEKFFLQNHIINSVGAITENSIRQAQVTREAKEVLEKEKTEKVQEKQKAEKMVDIAWPL